ncbi:lytic polysaccharide monooxygenase [Acanthopleuribacter pedis]|uniref:Lytic polysaccharide monooxygenase n=1 Tax=Acanthopleuribacter pedis TaxID=442870 RepID=A0A8J7U2Y7_9BACT|nr:lytic polysaccharide monooxygenase [Acanthopleuribacter pedis]MBO1318224.1 lytic polysaccharide monooxygenase [Acanthopleuribacter pedis]
MRCFRPSFEASWLQRPILLIGLFSLFVASLPVQAHGYAVFPKARQVYCEQDGGYWWPEDGSAIPNAACRAAFLETGHYPFVQSNEFAKLVADYTNMDAVMRAIPDGTLCAGGDPAKAGMDIPSSEWQVQYLQLDADGTFEFRFYASTPHNPSFWQFFLSREGFDPTTQRLTWDDLDLVDETGDVIITRIDDKPYYVMRVSLPLDRLGRAILFTRWQREDPAGEGFYNCSDIFLVDGNPSPWTDAGSFITPDVRPAEGDEVWFRVFDGTGSELIFERLGITANNQDVAAWTRELVERVNSPSDSAARVGILRDSVVSFDPGDLYANKVYVRDRLHTFQLDVKRGTGNQAPVVRVPQTLSVQSGARFTIAAEATDADGDALTYAWQLPAGFDSGDLATATLDASAPEVSNDRTVDITVSVSDGKATVRGTTAVTVRAGSSGGCDQTDPDADQYPTWQSGTVYNTGDRVSHNNLVWQAKWWTNSTEPSNTAEVWQLISDVPLVWNRNVAYPANTQVHHQGGVWQNQWWSRGDEPGQASVWQRVGDSDCQ